MNVESKENKKLSLAPNRKLVERFSKLAQEVADTFISMTELRQKVNEMFEVGNQLGKSPKQIKEVVKELTKGRISESTFRRWLPDWSKDQYMQELASKSHSRSQMTAVYHSDSNNKEIDLPIKHEIKEVEPEELGFEAQPLPERLSKELNRPETIHMTTIMLDCNKFRYELRDALVNSQKLKLHIKDGEVVKIG